ncbi:ABC transporter [Apiospora kogelbergensis]|uniref:ABC transporter n=1 Tax=Apiospora kogelbergensis TaxID=1337665 RepID=A0AAW0R279_9PEZI
MAILSMVTHPANMVMTIVPRAVAALSSFQRIQTFMLRPSLPPHREIWSEAYADTLSPRPRTQQGVGRGLAVHLCNVTIRHSKPLLSRVNIKVPVGALTIISGPTGSGKSTLMRAILGEVVPAEGSVAVSTRRIAYCAQRPWLPNGSIKEAIYGTTELYDAGHQEHESWYNKVTKACCLAHDFGSLTDGDQTQIGSRDDVLSGLDGDTEQTVFDNLFGARGLLRLSKTTVILVTNSDHVVILDHRGIRDQGPWGMLNIPSTLITKFSSGHQVQVDENLLSESFKNLSTQVQAKDEIKADLTRQSGDPALYGEPSSLLSLLRHS